MADVCSRPHWQGGQLSQGAQKPGRSDDAGTAGSASVATKLAINSKGLPWGISVAERDRWVMAACRC